MPAKVGAGKDGSDDGGAGGSGWEGGSGGGQVVVRPRVVLRFSAHVLVEPSCKRLDAGAGRGWELFETCTAAATGRPTRRSRWNRRSHGTKGSTEAGALGSAAKRSTSAAWASGWGEEWVVPMMRGCEEPKVSTPSARTKPFLFKSGSGNPGLAHDHTGQLLGALCLPPRARTHMPWMRVMKNVDHFFSHRPMKPPPPSSFLDRV